MFYSLRIFISHCIPLCIELALEFLREVGLQEFNHCRGIPVSRVDVSNKGKQDDVTAEFELSYHRVSLYTGQLIHNCLW